MVASVGDALEEALRSRRCCFACAFWHERPHAGKGSRGECRRFPPQVVMRTQPPPTWDSERSAWEQRPEHYFAMTTADQSCGEFKEAEK